MHYTTTIEQAAKVESSPNQISSLGAALENSAYNYIVVCALCTMFFLEAHLTFLNTFCENCFF